MDERQDKRAENNARSDGRAHNCSAFTGRVVCQFVTTETIPTNRKFGEHRDGGNVHRHVKQQQQRNEQHAARFRWRQ